jgi:hypothetical protein
MGLERSEIRNELGYLADALQKAKVPPKVIEPLTSAVERYHNLGPELQAIRDLGAQSSDIVNRIATGELSLAEGIKEYFLASVALQPTSRSNSMTLGTTVYEAAQARAIGHAKRWVVDNGERLVEIVDDTLAKLTAEAAALEPKLRGIESDGWAEAAGVATEWAKMHEVGRRRAALSRATDALLRLGVIEGAPA